ncbi:hypothetical protein [Mycoplasma procyoni]|uniref:hypothetical protein n=1 Tax=Mycoplasma procyoni TaxID=568784 RepID=UPI00197C75B6|nr:hypothetical protein [Mycoplasma procyoni]MBN3534440.1 hypothetical protein [Mycoplasma procyoni]
MEDNILEIKKFDPKLKQELLDIRKEDEWFYINQAPIELIRSKGVKYNKALHKNAKGIYAFIIKNTFYIGKTNSKTGFYERFYRHRSSINEFHKDVEISGSWFETFKTDKWAGKHTYSKMTSAIIIFDADVEIYILEHSQEKYDPYFLDSLEMKWIQKTSAIMHGINQFRIIQLYYWARTVGSEFLDKQENKDLYDLAAKELEEADNKVATNPNSFWLTFNLSNAKSFKMGFDNLFGIENNESLLPKYLEKERKELAKIIKSMKANNSSNVKSSIYKRDSKKINILENKATEASHKINSKQRKSEVNVANNHQSDYRKSDSDNKDNKQAQSNQTQKDKSFFKIFFSFFLLLVIILIIFFITQVSNLH